MKTSGMNESRLIGLAVSEGVARARVCLLGNAQQRSVPHYTIAEGQVSGENVRLDTAVERAAAQLTHLVEEVTSRVGATQAAIFTAQKLMVEDPVLRQEMSVSISENRMNAEAAVEKALTGYETALAKVDDVYLKERVSDIAEIRMRILDALAQDRPEQKRQGECHCAYEGSCILVAEELTPSQTVALDTAHVVGFITEKGGAASHVAILARALGIPAVTGIEDALRQFSHGDEVLLNGTTGEIIRWPSEATLHLYPSPKGRAVRPRTAVAPIDGLVVMANISLAEEVERVKDMLPEGIGLYRTEFELLAAKRMLSEDEQYERYAKVVKEMNGKPVYFRLFDFGGDKVAEFLGFPSEENPCLGYRGARLLLGQPEVFIPQARALARASKHGPVHVTYPMIADMGQFLRLREMFLQNVQDIPAGNIQHGVMFEVPSACLDAAALFSVADFGSIGSNDLIQYLFAVDRNNGLVAKDYHPDRPVFWSLLRHLAQAARFANRPLSLCGEMGGQPNYLPRLIELGIKTVSVSPPLIGLARMVAQKALREAIAQ